MVSTIWSDTKHFLCFPLSLTKYSLSYDRLFIESGFFKRQHEEILLYRVRDIGYTQTLFQRMFDQGDIIIYSNDRSRPELKIRNIKKVAYVKELIHENVEKMKLQRRTKVGEIIEDDINWDNPDDFF